LLLDSRKLFIAWHKKVYKIITADTCLLVAIVNMYKFSWKASMF
jgi:hypothetical protein